ncbi:MAG TPA: MFS transporter [Isosphaeraceae bacterium]|jgi:ACS family hexuronate transporter-like MFS transporter
MTTGPIEGVQVMPRREADVASVAARPAGRYRWVVCGLLFLATAINYVDRGILGVLAPTLEKSIGWTDAQYGDINAAFSFAYALGFLVVGRFIDRVGTRIGYAVALTAWSLAAAGHALARSAFGFGVARFLLGLGEAGNFPAAIKATAEWFPRRERALATGIFNAGSNVGAILAPLVVPMLTLRAGWPAAFAVTGLLGLLWVALWLPLYDRPERVARVSREELAWIRSDPPDPAGSVPWRRLLPHRQTWAVAAGKFLTDPIWWFYLFWSAKFLADRFGADLKTLGPPLVTIYLMADVGSVAGGWLSSRLIARGTSANASRKIALLACALCVVPVSLAPVVSKMWGAVLLIGLAAAAHQGFSANMYTLASDMFPRRAVGSVIGIAGMAGAVGGILMQAASGRIKAMTGSYQAMFTIAASAYVLAVLVIHALAPRLEPATLATTGQEAADG